MAAGSRWWWLGACSMALVAACAGEAGPEPFAVVSGPRAVVQVELRDAEGAVVWRLVAAPAAALDELVYGSVPAGFAQQLPEPGTPPRALRIGEPLTLEWVTPQRVIVQVGYADTGNRFVIGSWETRVRAPARDAAGLGDPPPEP